jgi:hypothetical protein
LVADSRYPIALGSQSRSSSVTNLDLLLVDCGVAAAAERRDFGGGCVKTQNSTSPAQRRHSTEALSILSVRHSRMVDSDIARFGCDETFLHGLVG